MYTKILVPLDGSPLAEQVLPWVRFLAKGLKVQVELLHAVDPAIIAEFSNPNQGRYVDLIVADMERKSIDYLNQILGSFPDPSKVVCSAQIGKPADVIVYKAAIQLGTLIAMATHGRSGAQRWLLGSVADKVLHMATNHLLLVRANKENKTTEEFPLKTVVVPLDGSPLAEKALPHIVELAKKINLDVVLVRVWSLPTSAYFGSEDYDMPNFERITEEVTKEAKGYLEEKVRQLKREGLEKVSSVLLEGDNAQEIISFGRQTPGNLVAMSTHGRSGLGRLVLGSVTDRVVCHSDDPVLVIRASTEGM